MWKQYIERTKHKAHSVYLEKALLLTSKKGNALDMGSGSGADVRFLVSQGFFVEAVDAEPYAQECIQDLIDSNQTTFYLSDFKEFNFKTYHLINASYALPFISNADFVQVWQQMLGAVEDDGLFVGQLFGVNDSWNKGDGKMNFHSKHDVEKLLQDWQIIELKEEEKDGKTAAGSSKRWHVFHIMAKKLPNNN